MAYNKKKIKKLFIEGLEKVPIVQVICERLSVGRATFYRWKEEDPLFAKAVEDALMIGREVTNDLCESKLFSKVSAGDMQAIKFHLEHNHPNYKKYSYGKNNQAPSIHISPVKIVEIIDDLKKKGVITTRPELDTNEEFTYFEKL